MSRQGYCLGNRKAKMETNRNAVAGLLKRVVGVIESTIGGLFGMVIAFELIVAGIGMVVRPQSYHISRVLTVPILGAAVLFDGWLVMALWDGLRDGRLPLGLSVARHMRRLHSSLRPLVAVVWIGHAVLLAASAYGMDRFLNRYAASGGFPVLPIVLLAFAMTFLCNIYIVSCFSAISPRSRIRRVFWRWRLAIDVAISVAAVLVA
jgi:hypothetical protein